jgi:hypothetical protein
MFNINVHCIVFGVNELLNKRGILSTNNEEITLPSFELNTENIKEINKAIISFLKTYIFINELILIPQIININCKDLNKEPNTLDMVFGFVIDYNSSIDNNKVFWLDFNPLVEHRLSNIIFETIQKLT